MEPKKETLSQGALESTKMDANPSIELRLCSLYHFFNSRKLTGILGQIFQPLRVWNIRSPFGPLSEENTDRDETRKSFFPIHLRNPHLKNPREKRRF